MSLAKIIDELYENTKCPNCEGTGDDECGGACAYCGGAMVYPKQRSFYEAMETIPALKQELDRVREEVGDFLDLYKDPTLKLCEGNPAIHVTKSPGGQDRILKGKCQTRLQSDAEAAIKFIMELQQQLGLDTEKEGE